MRRSHLALIVAPTLVFAACAENPDKRTLASLHELPADTADVHVQVNEGIDKATQSYQRFLDETPDSALTPEAMRRLADLKIEKEYGILGDGKLVDTPAPSTAPKVDARVDARAANRSSEQMPAPQATAKIDTRAAQRKAIDTISPATSERDLERRATN